MASLSKQVKRVVDGDNCSGCGACVHVSPKIAMGLDVTGRLVPTVTTDVKDRRVVNEFRAVCPGRTLSAPTLSAEATVDPIFGPTVGAWRGFATNAEFRLKGSSGGIVSALSQWLIQTGQVPAYSAVTASMQYPDRSVPISITTKAEALAAAGSRYAPASSLQNHALSSSHAFVGKPCEAAGLRALRANRQLGSGPPVISFFCAGTPRQRATEKLVAQLTASQEDFGEMASLRYRGNGWPGRFTVTDTSGREVSASYEESWGRTLGRDLPWRCKLCPDGTGEHADVSVGDFWETDAQGYPSFQASDGVSVLLARTPRGAALIQRAAADGVISIEPVALDAVRKIQPLQVTRRRTLSARLLGRTLAGRRIPRYRGFNLIRRRERDLNQLARATAGTFLRSFRNS